MKHLFAPWGNAIWWLPSHSVVAITQLYKHAEFPVVSRNVHCGSKPPTKWIAWDLTNPGALVLPPEGAVICAEGSTDCLTFMQCDPLYCRKQKTDFFFSRWGCSKGWGQLLPLFLNVISRDSSFLLKRLYFQLWCRLRDGRIVDRWIAVSVCMTQCIKKEKILTAIPSFCEGCLCELHLLVKLY